jgi:hypothetical protein
VAAGLVIFVMSVTGALLALKPQILAFAERDVRFVPVPPGASRLGVQAIVASAQRERPSVRPASVMLQADATASAAVTFGRDATVYVDPYSGRALGDGSKRAQRVFRTLEDWHRWLGVPAESRASGRAITGASNLAFFFLALTGPYLWWPRGWSWRTVRGIVWFRSVRGGRARDFNWHNVIGLWCAPILIVLTITGVVMSYPGPTGCSSSSRARRSGQRRGSGASSCKRIGRGVPAGESRRGVGAGGHAGAVVANDHAAYAVPEPRADDLHDCRRPILERVRALATDHRRRGRGGVEVGALRRVAARPEMARLGAFRPHRRTRGPAGPDRRRDRVRGRRRPCLDRPGARVSPAFRVAAIAFPRDRNGVGEGGTSAFVRGQLIMLA